MIIRRKGALVWVGLAALALFSAIFTFLAERGLWPALPPGAFHDWDLWIGLAGGVLLLWVLVWRRTDVSVDQRTGGQGDEETGRENG